MTRYKVYFKNPTDYEVITPEQATIVNADSEEEAREEVINNGWALDRNGYITDVIVLGE